MQDSGLRALVLRGYGRLVLIVVIVAALLAPTLVYGMIAARITLVVMGIGLGGISVHNGWTKLWSTRFAAAVAATVIPVLGVAVALGAHGPLAEVTKDVCALAALGMFGWWIPRMAARDRRFRERVDRTLSQTFDQHER